MSTSTTIHFGPLGVGLCVVLMAEVFAHGVRLREDQMGAIPSGRSG